MKIEIKTTTPKNGDKRSILKFAWIPTKVQQPYTGKHFIIWLDKYHEEQIFNKGASYVDTWAEWEPTKRWIS